MYSEIETHEDIVFNKGHISLVVAIIVPAVFTIISGFSICRSIAPMMNKGVFFSSDLIKLIASLFVFISAGFLVYIILTLSALSISFMKDKILVSGVLCSYEIPYESVISVKILRYYRPPIILLNSSSHGYHFTFVSYSAPVYIKLSKLLHDNGVKFANKF